MRISTYGFYCASCNKFSYEGFDSRDKIDLPDNAAVCPKCAPKYNDKNITTKSTRTKKAGQF